MPRIEKGCSALLRTQFRFAVTEGGGCAVDIDNEPDFDAAVRLYDRWRERQIASASNSPRARLPQGSRWPLATVPTSAIAAMRSQ